MKKKKLFLSIGIIILSLLVVCLIGFSPSIYKRLRGNANSFESDNGQAVKTGVVIDTKLINDGDVTSFPLKIYNGSDKTIKIKSFFMSNCNGSFSSISSPYDDIENAHVSCDEPDKEQLDKQIEVNPDSDYVRMLDFSTMPEDEMNFYKIGIQYELDNKTYNLSTYTILTRMDFSDFFLKNLLIINSSDGRNNVGTISNKTTFNLKEKSISATNAKDIIVAMPDEVIMDISEKLEDTGMFYMVYPNDDSEVDNLEVSHPQSQDSLTKNMLGESNNSNISQYFSFSNVNDVKSVSGKMLTGTEIASYDSNTGKYKLTEEKDGKKGIYFYLKGTPKRTIEKEKVIPGFYFKEFGTDYEYSSEKDDFTITSSSDVPSFTLTVYDKSKLHDAMVNWVNQFDKLNEDQIDVESFISSFEALYEGLNTYINRSVTQSEIDESIKAINDNPIKLLNKADYTELDKIKNSIASSNRSYYPEGSFNEIDELMSKYEAGLSENYQVKINNLTKKLTEKYNALEMLPADYSKVNSALETAKMLTNKTDGNKNLYSDESWNNLQDAIKSVVEGKKINEQEIVNGYALKITNAIANLEYAPADYTKLNEIIDNYNLNKDYFVEESTKAFEEYLKNITNDKKVTEQSVVDNWYDELKKLSDFLKFKKALGYYDADNYEYLKTMNLMSLEGYKKYYESLNKDYYTDESIEIIDSALEYINDLYENEYTIDKQDEFNEYLIEFQASISMLDKKMGNYEELCKYYFQAFNLNSNYYKDLTELLGVLSDIDFDLKIDEQDKIDNYTKNLKDALNNLELKDADYTEFNKAYDRAKGLNPKHYVDFNAVEAAIKEANRSKNLKIDQQNIVDDATDKLNKALKDLVLKDADYSKIESLKATIESFDSNKYTNFDVVKDALDDIVYGKKANEQDVVDEMYNKLKKAYESLDKVKADYKEVEKAVSDAKKYESLKDNYENYSQLLNALDSVNYDLKWDQQDIVDGYANKINDAINNLKKKEANYTELEQLVSKVPNDYSNVDKSLRSQIESLLNEARNLPRNLTFEEQYRIDDLVFRLRSLIDKLPKIDKYENSKEIILSYLKVNGNDVNIKTLPFRYKVDYDVTSASIEVGLASKTSTSNVYGGKVLLTGENNVTIIVTTKDGKTYTYNLIITRSTFSNYLKSLKIKQSNIDFVKTKQEYTVKIGKNINKLDLTIKPEDENAKVTVKGNKNLKNGSKVKIEVRIADGNVRVYTLNIQKNGYIDVKIIILIIMILTVISGIFKYIQENKKYK